MKGKNVTIFGLGAIGGFIGGNVFAFYKMLHSKRIRKALTDIVADKIETVLYGEECHPQRTIQGYLTATITKTKTDAINRILFWKIYCLELNLTLCLFLVQ